MEDSTIIKDSSNQNKKREQNSNRIKVIHIYKDFDIYNGLIERFLVFARGLNKKKFEFKVCVFNYKGSSFGEEFRQIGGTIDSLGMSWEDNPAVVYKLYKYLKKEKPHIIQTYILKPNFFGRIAAILAGVPVIISTELTLKNQAPTFIRRVRDLFFHPINAFLNNYSDLILCSSEAIKKQWETIKTADKIKVINPHYDATKLLDLDDILKNKKYSNNANWVIGTVGRLSEEKRHVDLFKAFREISELFPKASLLIVGDGYMREDLLKIVREMNLENKIRFVGFQKNVFLFLKKMDIFVLPSRTEGFGIVILEAMAMGLPVIATNVGGIPEIVIHNNTGILVEPNNSPEIVRAILKLLSDPRKMKEMGERGRERAINSYSVEKFISQHEECYRSLFEAVRD